MGLKIRLNYSQSLACKKRITEHAQSFIFFSNEFIQTSADTRGGCVRDSPLQISQNPQKM